MFSFKKFDIDDSRCAMKVGTDGVLLGAWADCSGVSGILDAGCGSGLISLMMAQRNPDARIIGVDIDGDACADAKANIARSPWPDRIDIIHGDVLDLDGGELRYPLLIISNPPFFNETLHSPVADRAIARHGDGFDPLALIDLADRLLLTTGDSLAFVAPAARSDEIEFRLVLRKFCVYRRAQVFSREGRPALRTLFQVGKDSSHSIEDTAIVIRDSHNNLTEQYRNLTLDFYLDK